MFAGTDFSDTAVTETRAKHSSRDELRSQLERLKSGWATIRERLRRQLLPADEMKRRLDQVGAPSEPEQIGISRERLRDTFRRAYHIRRRFTVLDVAVRTGSMEFLLDQLFGSTAKISRAR
jgi:glycerol-1-phosphate dehydrogenase [NAD(P)+]